MFPGADYLDFSFDGKPYCLCSDGAACEGAGVLSVDPELCLYRVAQGRARTFELGSGDELQGGTRVFNPKTGLLELCSKPDYSGDVPSVYGFQSGMRVPTRDAIFGRRV